MWWLLKLSIILQYVNSVRIINMRVPEVIQFGTKESVTLDCDYVTGNVTGLVVKWFYMDKTQPVYQWIPPLKPQALGVLKNKVDLTHKVSRNPYTQHRAIHIISPGTELTGNYTCVISTFLAEDEKTKPMTIFVPERRFDMIQDRLGNGYLNIICSAEGVFPKPEITILAGNRLNNWNALPKLANNADTLHFLDPGFSSDGMPTIPGNTGKSERPLSSKSSIKKTNERYTLVTSSIVKIESLPPTVEILCDMHVPLANYFSRKRDIFYRDPPPTTPDTPNSAQVQDKDRGTSKLPTTWLIVASILYLFRIHIT